MVQKCSIEKQQTYQLKPIAVETADPNRTLDLSVVYWEQYNVNKGSF